MLSLNDNLNTGTQTVGPKVNAILKHGLSDQKEWLFDRPFSIGRDSSADICIKDATVSRLHVCAHLTEGQWWIRDMDSSNGTFVNGKRIAQCPVDRYTELQLGCKGPVLQIGLEEPDLSDSKTIVVDLKDLDQFKTQLFQLRDEPEKDPDPQSVNGFYGFAKTALEKFRDSSKNRRKSGLLAAGVLTTVLILTGYTIVHKPAESTAMTANAKVVRSQTDSGDAGTRAAEKPDERQRKMLQKHTADIYFNAAEKFSDHHHWQPALAYYQKAAGMNPEHAQIDSKIAGMQFEMTNQAAYEQGKKQIEAGRYGWGIEQLRRIDENSFYYQQSAQLIADAEKRQALEDEEQRQKEAEMLRETEKQKAIDTIDSALGQYAAGDIKACLETLDLILSSTPELNDELKDRAGTLKKEITDANALFEKANQAYKSRKINTALSTWEKLIEADQKLLAGRDGYFTNTVRPIMADEYGAIAGKAYAKNDLPTAYKYSQMALKQNENHSKAREVKTMLDAKAKQLFQTGYVIEAYSPDKAQEKWRQILKICDPDSEYYKKALEKVGAN